MSDRIPPDVYTMLSMLVLSAVSAIVSITQRLSGGQTASVMWVTSEFMAAILVGYLASETYPFIKQYFPEFVRLPLFVSFCAYGGGRTIQTAERIIYSQLPGNRR